MRSAEQITRTVGAWKDHQERERVSNLLAFLELTKRARDRGEPWIAWIDKRARGEHDHSMTDDRGQRIACPVGGCRD